MTTPRGPLGPQLGLATAAAGTTWLAFFAWTGFTVASTRYLLPLLFLAAVVAGTGAVARWARIPALLGVLLQWLLSGAVVSLVLSGSPVPVGPAWIELQLTLDSAFDAAMEYPAPVPLVRDGVHPLLILGGFACLLLVDLLACTLRRVPLAGLPLLAVYSVPVSMLEDGVSWWVFAITAGGFLLMLYLQVSDQLTRWGRPLGSTDADADPSGFNVRTGAVGTSAGTIGAASTALAVVLPIVIPTLTLSVFDFGNGPGDDDIVLENPMLDLRKDLRRGLDIPLVRVTTEDPDPSYLRVAVLNRFSDNEWSSGDRQVPTDQLADGRTLPPPQGLASSLDRRAFDYDISVTSEFQSTWLPTYPPATTVDAAGDWRFDLSTMDFLAGTKDVTTSGMFYSTSALDITYDAVAMARAPSSGGQVSEEYLDLPDGFPSAIRNLAFQVTRHEPTRFEQAQRLQRWFREDGGFTYDINAEDGSGTDELLEFLLDGENGRVGYCEQFAASMAVMARVLGIPARVATGFLDADPIGNDTWEFSAYDMHAWPELYFPGAGWVPFEPTPPGVAEDVPGYTTADVPDLPEEERPELPRESDNLPERGASSDAPSDEESAQDEADADDTEGAFPWLPVGGGLAGALLVGGLVLLPRTVRARRSGARAGGGPEAAWLELRDTALDLRIPWPEERSPRETRDVLVQHLGLPVSDETAERPLRGPDVAPDAVAALDLIVRAVERLRYARSDGASPAAMRAELGTVVEALYGGAHARVRRRATWWPRSVLTRRRLALPRVGTVTVRNGAIVDRV